MHFSYKLPPDIRFFLDKIPALIEKTFPIPGRFRSALPSGVAELSRLLTGGRGERPLSYMSRPNFLAAYLRYFLPWNLYRLCLLLPNLDINLSTGDSIVDFGSGPLTLPLALWISRPDIRSLSLEFRCIDCCAPALEAGKKLFAAVSGNSPWKIHVIRENINLKTKNYIREKSPSLVCAINLYNEIYEDIPHSNSEGLKRMAYNAAGFMDFSSASVLTVEPGVPRSGHFISFLRSALLELNYIPVSPCTHTSDCPLPVDKKRWCHFAFETTDAPKELHRLSAAAGIPKERLVLSYLLVKPQGEQPPESKQARIISDSFPLTDYQHLKSSNLYGCYGCSSDGLILLTGEKARISKIANGSLIKPVFSKDSRYDAKSGALIVELN
jgi:hypothetical protein